MATNVLCEVNSCSFWASGNKCDAAAIYVVSSRGNVQASTSEETDCKTFIKKDNPSPQQ